MEHRVLNGYGVGRELGKGAFGTVYLCAKDGKEFAMKELMSTSRQASKAAEKEANMLLFLDHANVVKLVEYFKHQRKTYMIMELLAGRELFDIIVDDNMFDDLTEDILKGMIRQVALGLEHIHSKNIVHLDLKPENLIANKNPNGDFNCKIVDFGIAEHVTDELRSLNGTDGYKAPEQIQYEQITGKSDMWALGCITYEVMSGCMAFYHDTPVEFCKKVMDMDWSMDWTEDDLEEDETNPFDEISQEGKDFVKKLIAFDPNERLTAKEALNHSWLHVPEKAAHVKEERRAKMMSLVFAKKRLRKVQARRRWRNVINAVRAMNNMARLVRHGSVESASTASSSSSRDEEIEILRKIIYDKLGPDFNIQQEMLKYM